MNDARAEKIARDLLSTMREAAQRLDNESHDPEEVAEFLRFSAAHYETCMRGRAEG